MARTKEQNERIRQNTKSKIHSAAIVCFSQNGFGKTTMQELANYAEISVGSLYRHYKTKEELFDALVDEAILGQEYLIKQMETHPPKEAIKWLIEEVVSDFSKGTEFSHQMKIMLENTGDKQIEGNNRVILSIAGMIKQGQKDGIFTNGNPVQLAQFLVATIQGLCSMQLLFKDDFIIPTSAQIASFLEGDKQNAHH